MNILPTCLPGLARHIFKLIPLLTRYQTFRPASNFPNAIVIIPIVTPISPLYYEFVKLLLIFMQFKCFIEIFSNLSTIIIVFTIVIVIAVVIIAVILAVIVERFLLPLVSIWPILPVFISLLLAKRTLLLKYPF